MEETDGMIRRFLILNYSLFVIRYSLKKAMPQASPFYYCIIANQISDSR